MTDVKLAPDGRARHWLIDAAVGGAVALFAMTMAHAALPDPSEPMRRSPPPQRVALTSAPADQAEPVLIAFEEPVPGRGIVSPFGLRQMPWEESGRLHAGVDISAEAGEPVLAAADGVVTDAGRNSTYGRYVAVRHAAGLTSFYAHLGGVAPHIVPGLAVKAGDPLGRIGNTGTSTGPHLHFEIRDRRDRPLNPSLFIGRAFAEADELPLRAAQRFGRRVRVAFVSTIPDNKRALMAAKLEREAAEKALRDAEKAPKLAANSAAKPAARDAAAAGQPAAASEAIEGLQGLTVGEDGRPRAQLTL